MLSVLGTWPSAPRTQVVLFNPIRSANVCLEAGEHGGCEFGLRNTMGLYSASLHLHECRQVMSSEPHLSLEEPHISDVGHHTVPDSRDDYTPPIILFPH